MTIYNSVTPEILSQLTAVLGADNVSTAKSERELRTHDAGSHEAPLADVVVWPETAEQVAAVLKLANQHHVPVTPWGVGTSLEGNPLAVYGGIQLSTERMTRILAVHADDFQVTVQPGIPYKDLNTQLAAHGLFFPPDPGANATIGGMLANNAAGIRTVKYGASRDNVLRMQVALADGRLIHVGSRSVKQSAGYDLLHLFVGHEGTLGIITEATLKLAPVPELMSAVVATFPNNEAAIQTVVAVRGSGLEPAALEFIDAGTSGFLTREKQADFGENPTVFMEFHAAHEESLQLGLALATEICEEMGATRIRATSDPAERKQLWHARHHMFETAVRIHPGDKWLLMDVAVPISRLPEMVAHIQVEISQLEKPGYIVGHAGDGNVHVMLPYHDAKTHDRGTAVNQSVVMKALALGGTATGEHGVGIGKAKFMPHEHGEALQVMRDIKKLLDPNGILNPGKIFPPV
ncbi:MAG: FAD-binding oxidoreductase [Candidatus Promineifilaceae bacterium]